MILWTSFLNNSINMTKQQAIDQAIERIKGQEVKPGTIVACKQDPQTWEFIGYDGDFASVKIGDKLAKFQRTEIFDINKCKNVVNHLLNLGFWEDGMESILL